MKVRWHIFLVIILLTLGIASIANTGFYFGVSVSRDIANFRSHNQQTVTISPVSPSRENFSQFFNFDWNGDGFNGGVFLGYMHKIYKRLNLGVELFADVSTLQGDFSSNYMLEEPAGIYNFPVNARVRMTGTLGISILPSIDITQNTKLISRIGWAYSHFKYSSSGNFSTRVFNLPITPLNFAINKSGIQLGFGLLSMFAKHFGIQFEYDWTYYGNIHGTVAATQIGTDNFGRPVFYNSTAKLKPQVDQFKIAIVYQPSTANNTERETHFKKIAHPSGFYLGAGISRDYAQLDTQIARTVTTLPISIAQSINFNWNVNGIDGEFLLGYLQTINRHFNLSAEMFGDISSLYRKFQANTFFKNTTIISLRTNPTIRIRYSIGFSLLPGLQITNNTKLLMRIGWIYSQFQYNDIGTIIESAESLPINPANFNSYKSGLQLGIGMATKLSKNIDIRMEYDWSYYGTIKKAVGPSIIGILNGGTTTSAGNVNLKPKINRFKVTLVCYIN